MTVSVDATTNSSRTDTSNPYTFNHTGAGSGVRGVLLFVMNMANDSNWHTVQAPTYGGVAMHLADFGYKEIAEAGIVQLFYLGRGDTIPQGTQEVSSSLRTATGDDMNYTCITLLGNNDVVLVDYDGSDPAVEANTSIPLSYGGYTCMAFFGMFYGGIDTGIAAGAGMTQLAELMYASSRTAWVGRQTTATSSDFTPLVTSTSDDAAAVAVAVTDDASARFKPITVLFDNWTRGARTGTEDPFTFTHVADSRAKVGIVAVVQNTSATGFVASVKWGSQTMSFVEDAVDSATEPGRVDVFFYSSENMPTGSQTIEVDFTSGTTNDQIILATSWLADERCEVFEKSTVETEQTPTVVTIPVGGRMSLGALFYFSGGVTLSAVNPTGAIRILHNASTGNGPLSALFASASQSANGHADHDASTSDKSISLDMPLDDLAIVALAFGPALNYADEWESTPENPEYLWLHEASGITPQVSIIVAGI